MTARNLAAYRARLEDSFVMKDLKKYQHLPEMFHHNHQFFTAYPELLNRRRPHPAHRRRRGQENQGEARSARASSQRRSLFGLMGDAFKLWRAFE